MARGIAATVALVALVSVLIVRTTAMLTDSPLLIGLAILTVLSGAATTGLVVASRASAAYNVLARRDHAVAVAASHELRTPITSLRLSLEDLTLWPTTPPEVVQELHRAISELDRLSDAVTHLLDQHREDHLVGVNEVDLGALTRAAVDRWRTTIDHAREVRFDARGITNVRLDASSIGRVLTAQLAQFAEHGTGKVTIEVVRVGQTIQTRVCDESTPRFAPGVIHGPTTGKDVDESLTLEEAGCVAEALGGYLAVEDVPTTCIALILPASSRTTTV